MLIVKKKLDGRGISVLEDICTLKFLYAFYILQTQREEAKKFAEIKRKLRQEIQELRHTVLQMMGDNQQAPEIEKLDRYEYNLDVDQRQKLILEGEEKIKQVRKAGLNIYGNTTPCFTLSSLPFGL